MCGLIELRKGFIDDVWLLWCGMIRICVVSVLCVLVISWCLVLVLMLFVSSVDVLFVLMCSMYDCLFDEFVFWLFGGYNIVKVMLF